MHSYCCFLCFTESLEDLYAFHFQSADLPEQASGWDVFDLQSEYLRQGVPNSNWVLSNINKDYDVSNISSSSSPSNSKMTHQCWCLRIWAWSPKVEAQILLQSWQGTAVLGFGTLFFLADLLSSRLCSQLLSKCFVPLSVAAVQAGRSWPKTCHSSTGML